MGNSNVDLFIRLVKSRTWVGPQSIFSPKMHSSNGEIIAIDNDLEFNTYLGYPLAFLELHKKISFPRLDFWYWSIEPSPYGFPFQSVEDMSKYDSAKDLRKYGNVFSHSVVTYCYLLFKNTGKMDAEIIAIDEEYKDFGDDEPEMLVFSSFEKMLEASNFLMENGMDFSDHRKNFDKIYSIDPHGAGLKSLFWERLEENFIR